MIQTCPEIEKLLERLVPYIIINRKGKAFIGWTEEQIENTLRDAILDCTFLFSSDEDGNILGVVHGYIDDKKKLFHVTNCLTSSPNVLRLFVGAFSQMYPTLSLAGYRHGNYKAYNTKKFKEKLLLN